MTRELPAPGETHVWFHRNIGNDHVANLSQLSRGEKVWCARISYPELRVGFAAARAGLRYVLADYLGVAPCTVNLQPELAQVRDAPIIIEGPGTELIELDLAWSPDMWLLGVTLGAQLGVAFEQVRTPPVLPAPGANPQLIRLAARGPAASPVRDVMACAVSSPQPAPLPGAAPERAPLPVRDPEAGDDAARRVRRTATARMRATSASVEDSAVDVHQLPVPADLVAAVARCPRTGAGGTLR